MESEFKAMYPGEVDPREFLAAAEGRPLPKAPIQEGVEVKPGSDRLLVAFREFLKAGSMVLAILEEERGKR
jgi:hypothetical protein